MLTRLDQNLPELLFLGIRAPHALHVKGLLNAAGHVDERVCGATAVEILVGAAQFRVRLLQQRRPELIGLLAIITEYELVARVDRQSIVNNNVHPLAVVPEAKVKYASVV